MAEATGSKKSRTTIGRSEVPVVGFDDSETCWDIRPKGDWEVLLGLAVAVDVGFSGI